GQSNPEGFLEHHIHLFLNNVKKSLDGLYRSGCSVTALSSLNLRIVSAGTRTSRPLVSTWAPAPPAAPTRTPIAAPLAPPAIAPMIVPSAAPSPIASAVRLFLPIPVSLSSIRSVVLTRYLRPSTVIDWTSSTISGLPVVPPDDI